MVKLRNKQLVFCVTRSDFTGNSVVVAVTADMERADELVGEYTQLFIDRGYSEDEVHFYSQATTFYDYV